jgi:hypothetical protein
MALFIMPHLETGSQKIKMAAAKPDVVVSPLQYKKAKKFRLLSICFNDALANGAYCGLMRLCATLRDAEIQDG